MLGRTFIIAALLTSPAWADEHHHEHMHHHHSGAHELLGTMHVHDAFVMSLSVLAADYTSPLFEGDYQGGIVGAWYSRGRFGGGASIGAYEINKNGRDVTGVGDLMLHGHVTAYEQGDVKLGAMLMVSLPTGNDVDGIGMGHVMLMPEAWITYAPGPFALAASAGYARMQGGAAAHAEHGAPMWPLVDPMYAQEITFGGTAMYSLTHQLGVGVRGAGAVPVGADTVPVGDSDLRLSVGGRAVWIAGPVTTTFEVMGGVAGDPFGLRGVLETALRFN
ncbi:MAG TPA: hypothetical protein VGM39_06270 [Kofleriaceae bacterium]|jgi:hypothetical protein